MVNGNPKATGRRRSILRIFLVVVFLLLAGAIFSGALLLGVIPDTVPQSHEISPDGQTRVTIVEEAYGTFGPVNYVVRIGPENFLLNWILQKKLIETDAEGSRVVAPTATWVDAKSLVINLPVKQSGLAAAVRDGLYPHPAVDRYGAIRIVYRAQ